MSEWRRTTSVRVVVATGLAIAFALAFFVSPHASSSPDGLEKVASEHGLDTQVGEHVVGNGPLADYSVRGVADASLSAGLAGVIGVAVTFVAATGALMVLQRTRRRRAVPSRPAGA